MTDEDIARFQSEAHRGFQCGQSLFVDLVENLRIAVQALREIASSEGRTVIRDVAREALAEIRGKKAPEYCHCPPPDGISHKIAESSPMLCPQCHGKRLPAKGP